MEQQMENNNILVISPESNVVFVGKYNRYIELKQELREYSSKIRKKYNYEEFKNLDNVHVYGDFLGPEEMIIFREGENNVYDCIIRVLTNFYHRHEIEARIKAEPFKNFKFEENGK
jgi:hypothetical protein